MVLQLGVRSLLNALAGFLRGSTILAWIHAVACSHPIRVLLHASASLSDFSRKLSKVHDAAIPIVRREADQRLIDNWATELGKIVGKFGGQLWQQPDSIYDTIPPFCPANSMLHKQFVRKQHLKFNLNTISAEWDDSPARLSYAPGYESTAIAAEGRWIAIVGTLDKIGTIMLYHGGTLETCGQLNHGDRIRKVQINSLGTLLASCGYATTKVWEIETGNCVATATNPPTRPYPQTVLFSEDDDYVLIGTNDRRIWSLSLSDQDSTLDEVTRIVSKHGGSPTCAAFSPDGQQIAYGYRHRALLISNLETFELTDSCAELSNVAQVVWHPYNGEVYGLMHNLSGMVFKWHPGDEKPTTQFIEVSVISINNNGNILALGDQHGNIKLLTTEDLVLVFQVASQDPVLGLAFSADCRQLYDVRRSYVNVWEPNALLKLAELAPQLSDIESATERTLVKPTPVISDKVYPRVDPISAVAAYQLGRLYCAGTLAGIVRLYDTTHGQLCTLNQSANFFSIQQIAWSNDGQVVCYADVSRTIFVDTIKTTSGLITPVVERLLELRISSLEDNIAQVIFHPHARLILVCSPTAAVVVSLDTKAVVTTTRTDQGGRWIHHPSHEDHLVHIESNEAHVFTWPTLERKASISFDPDSQRYTDYGSTGENNQHHTAGLPGDDSRPKVSFHHVLTAPSGRHILIQASSPKSLKLIRLLRIEKSPSPLDTDDIEFELVDVDLPPKVTSVLDRPLAFVSSKAGSSDLDTLLFLDCNAWVCSWKVVDREAENLPSRRRASVAVSKGRVSTQGPESITAHFCLPGDWVSPSCVELFRSFLDRTLLCPRNGEVSVIRWNEP